jgi:hypothetical protein
VDFAALRDGSGFLGAAVAFVVLARFALGARFAVVLLAMVHTSFVAFSREFGLLA